MSSQLEKPILVAIDAVLFNISHKKLNVLLVKIGNGVYKEKWAVPGGLIDTKESPEQAVTRVLSKRTGLNDVYFEQLYTFGHPNRDKRGRSISIAYFALIPSEHDIALKKLEFYKEIKWWAVTSIPKMAFDHKEIVEKAYQRLKSKLSYSNIAYSLLPKEFTFTEIQGIYEIILEEKLDKRNFRKSILAKGIIEETGNILKGQNFRPAKLYRFCNRSIRLFD